MPEEVVQSFSVRKTFLKISQNSQKTPGPESAKETLAQVFSCEFCKMFKKTFFYRTPPAAATVMHSLKAR